MLAFIANALGHFEQALSIATPLAARARDRRVKVAASLTAGSALRQLDRHADAEPHDRRALRLATTNVEKAHALASLVADAVLTDRRRTERRLTQARALRVTDPRAQIRLLWVDAEANLVLGRSKAAVRDSERALALSRRAGFRRHEAKSLLFLGVALHAAGYPGKAKTRLVSARRMAARIGAVPVEEAASTVLGRMP